MIDDVIEAVTLKASERVSDLNSAALYIKRSARLMAKHGVMTEALEACSNKLRRAAVRGISDVVDIAQFE